jgi:carbonic anhydrase
LACSDSRVAPEIVFDQPLGSVFAARTPGNVHADSVKWMLDIAVGDLGVPLVLVVGHTGCLAVTQIVEGKLSGPGGPLRAQIQSAYLRVRGVPEDQVLRAAVEENVYETVSRLKDESWELRRAVGGGSVLIAGAVYDMKTGSVEFLRER